MHQGKPRPLALLDPFLLATGNPLRHGFAEEPTGEAMRRSLALLFLDDLRRIDDIADRSVFGLPGRQMTKHLPAGLGIARNEFIAAERGRAVLQTDVAINVHRDGRPLLIL